MNSNIKVYTIIIKNKKKKIIRLNIRGIEYRLKQGSCRHRKTTGEMTVQNKVSETCFTGSETCTARQSSAGD